ncbi:unnamed protein product, partial [Polarella glacialis]
LAATLLACFAVTLCRASLRASAPVEAAGVQSPGDVQRRLTEDSDELPATDDIQGEAKDDFRPKYRLEAAKADFNKEEALEDERYNTEKENDLVTGALVGTGGLSQAGENLVEELQEQQTKEETAELNEEKEKKEALDSSEVRIEEELEKEKLKAEALEERGVYKEKEVEFLEQELREEESSADKLREEQTVKEEEAERLKTKIRDEEVSAEEFEQKGKSKEEEVKGLKTKIEAQEKSAEEFEVKEKEEEEEEGEKEEEEEGEEEEEHFSASDQEVAYMLLGSVALVVSLFYFVNWDDDDIRLYTWSILSMTISIFTSVLMFHGLGEFLSAAVEEMEEFTKVAAQYTQVFVYLVVLQLTVGYESGMIGSDSYVQINLDEDHWTIADAMRADHGRQLTPSEEDRVRNKSGTRSNMIDLYGNEVPVMKRKLVLEQRTRRIKCFALLLAHMTAFAAIRAGSTLQHTTLFSSSPFMAFLPVILTAVPIQLCFTVSNAYRTYHLESAKQAGRAGRRAKMAHEAIVEAENDIMSLSTSFLTVQCIRFALSGILADGEGLEEPEKPHGLKTIGGLYLVSLIFAALSSRMALWIALQPEEEEGEEERTSTRFAEMAMSTFGDGFAWSLLFATRYVCVVIPFIKMETMFGRVEFALILSIFAGVTILGLDAVDDAFKASGNDEASGPVIGTIINALGLFVGFSWEQSFSFGVEAVTATTPHKHFVQLAIGTFVFILMVRPWRRFILTKVMYLEEFKKSQTPAKEKYSARAMPMGHGTENGKHPHH